MCQQIVRKKLKSYFLAITFYPLSGFSKNDIVDEFYQKETLSYDKNLNKWRTKFDPENYKAKNFSEEVIDAKNNKTIVKIGEKINRGLTLL